MTVIPDITLNNGQTIPQFGFGVFMVKPADTAAVVSAALEAGYRHIDTAEMYGNEMQVGEAISRSGLDRSEVYVTSKLSNDARRPDDARRAFDESLKARLRAVRCRDRGDQRAEPERADRPRSRHV